MIKIGIATRLTRRSDGTTALVQDIRIEASDEETLLVVVNVYNKEDGSSCLLSPPEVSKAYLNREDK